MAEVKWIKITTDIFDDEKILLIESLPDSDAIIVIWFKLLALAGKQNNSGVFMMGRIPYTDKMLATIFRRKEATVTMALNTFEQFGMIEIVDGVITIPNWGKHQSLDQLEGKKEYMRNYMKEYREKQKAITSGEINRKPNSKTNNKANVSSLDKDIKEEKEEDKKRIDYQLIADMYNEICVSFPRVTLLSAKRKQAIKARLNIYSVEQFKEMFEKAEASPFLKGQNNKNWQANFDWLIKDGNFAKVLDGNYAETKGGKTRYGNFDPEEAFQKALKRSYGKGRIEPEMHKSEGTKTAGEDEEVKAKAEALKRRIAEGG